MEKKTERIARFVGTLSGEDGDVPPTPGGEGPSGAEASPFYLGFFTCFNRQEFYEAHDVLEDLWLREGKQGANHAYYKGLIQLAGAFVHLQKGRLKPAVALFRLAEDNLRRYPDLHQGLDLAGVLRWMHWWRDRVEQGMGTNPLDQYPPPCLHLHREVRVPADPISKP
jgi:hypothetical protein